MPKRERVWSLQEAKAKFSEVVRLAQSEGPQTVTVHGKPAVRIIPATGQRHAGIPTVDEILAAFQACPVKNFKIPRIRSYGRFRKVDL